MTVLIHTGTPKKKNETSDQEAVRAVGGVLELADLIEAPQLPVSRLSNVPARALSVEAVMDLASEILCRNSAMTALKNIHFSPCC